MRFVSYNIQYGVGKDCTRDLDRIAAVVQRADVIALQEVARHLPMIELEDQPARLAELLPGCYRTYGRSIDVQAPEADPMAPRMQFGNMLLARCPIVATRTHLLPKRRLVDYPSTERVAVEAVIQTASRAIRVYSIHLSPNNVQERKLQVEALLRIQRDVRLEGTVSSGAHFLSKRNRLSLPDVVDDAVFMEDFNLEPSSEEYTMPELPSLAHLVGARPRSHQLSVNQIRVPPRVGVATPGPLSAGPQSKRPHRAHRILALG